MEDPKRDWERGFIQDKEAYPEQAGKASMIRVLYERARAGEELKPDEYKLLFVHMEATIAALERSLTIARGA